MVVFLRSSFIFFVFIVIFPPDGLMFYITRLPGLDSWGRNFLRIENKGIDGVINFEYYEKNYVS